MSAVWWAVALLYVFSGLISPGMFQLGQILNILQVAAFLGVVATGQTIALLTGGIDLSVAGMVTMANIVSTSVMAGQSSNILPAVIVCLLLAGIIGLANGFIIAIVRVTPLVATLAMNSILFGAALVYTQGAPHGGIAPEYAVFGQGHFGILPFSTICWVFIVLAVAFLMHRTIFGRQLYAVGANTTAAGMMGIAVHKIVMATYMLSATMAVLGGLLLTSYIGSPSLGIGDQFLLTSIAATVVGGTALSGGIGSVIETIGGTLFITELNTFTNIVHVSTGVQFVLQGTVIALSVLAYRLIGFSRAAN
ncbi:MAG TPA: ABC transporter permease [Chthoniobacterales bacterium]|nr:ABC transporter permease [Chthoniobacterales bacterium]